ncbi:MAG TPA: hypothetical protein PLV87_10525, partial [Opitutaceae bacterium]|nr:hypothetical protein [Opitutaceae bacterium]
MVRALSAWKLFLREGLSQASVSSERILPVCVLRMETQTISSTALPSLTQGLISGRTFYDGPC